MSLPSIHRLALAVLAAIACQIETVVAQQVFNERGFHSQREPFSQLPFEHVDPLTGNLLLTFTDLVLPGNAGFDLRIQRTYNSKIYRNYQTTGDLLAEDSWAGIGWTLHLGRVFHGLASDGADPIIEMPDGSRHHAYPHISPPAGCSPCFVTKEFWIYDKSDTTLRLPNGTVYTFGHLANTGSADGPALYATEIADTFANSIAVEYVQTAGAPADRIMRIVQDLGSQTRQVTFGLTGTFQSIASMTFSNRTWTYAHDPTVETGQSLLRRVTPPVGAPWAYAYNTAASPRFELTSITTPHGGTVTYVYEDETFNLGSTVPVPTRVLARRTTGGRDVPGGTWTYAYAQGGSRNQTVIVSPCNTLTYEFLGVGTFTTIGSAWRVGLPSKRTTTAAGLTLETEEWDWIPSTAISFNEEIIGLNHDADIFVPLLRERLITRGGATFRTVHTYSASASTFNDYGRPNQSVETGNRGAERTTTRTFRYGFTPYIVDKLATETVRVGTESFATAFTHNLATGFLTEHRVYGIPTVFAPTPAGNVASMRDANGFITTFSYDWATASFIQTPEHSTTRQINTDGTIASETRRNASTSFSYDLLGRLRELTPPAGNKITTTYDGASTFVRVARGSSFVVTRLDGFGRESETENAVGVTTDRTYDACGRLVYESYPYTSANIGTSIAYDGLNRPTRRTHPDIPASAATYSYTAIDVRMTDEEQRNTTQEFTAFGDPDEGWLTAVVDGVGQRTTYEYNAVGRLQEVTPPSPFGSRKRLWAYNSKNQVETETHPENGTTRYLYDDVGSLKQLTDARNQVTTFTYDGNNRLRVINRPQTPLDPAGTQSDVTFTYDASDNRKTMVTGSVSTTFDYDAANRLKLREDQVNGRTLTTLLDYDGNDNLNKIDYPSGRRVTYTHDNANRIASVRDGSGAAFATSVEYHPSGNVASFTAGNGAVQSFGFDRRYRPSDIDSGPLKLTYTYDRVGNVETISDLTRTGFNQSLIYDNLDRLKTVTGWGSSTFIYDALGNRTSKSAPAVTYTYDGNSRLESATGVEQATFTHDANGNLTVHGTTTYDYTPHNMVDRATVSGRVATYRYDGDDLRTVKTVDSVTTYAVHGPGGLLLSEYDEGAGRPFGWLRDHVYVGTRLLAGVSCRFSISPADGAVAAGATSGGVSLTATAGCSWTSSSSVPWISVTAGAAGTSSGTVSYSVAANTGTVPRTGSLTIAGQLFTLTQNGVQCTFSLSPDAASSGSAGGAGTVSLSTSEGCAWTASSNAAWLSVTSGSSGAGNGTIGYAVAANPSAASRTGTLTIGEQTFTVTQAGASCGFAITPVSATMSGAGGPGSVSVSASPADCGWTASSAAGWIAITAGQSGTGSGTVSYSAAANGTTTARSGTLTIAGQIFTLTQDGATSVPRMYVDVPADGATVGPPFPITGWAIDLAAPSGTGVSTVHVWAYPNPGSGQPAVFMGAASYGHSRPDVAAAFGAQFENAGFTLTISGMAAGPYQFVAFAYSTVTGSFSLAHAVTVTIPSPNPQVAIDLPGSGQTVGQPFTVAGWAVDLAASTGTGVDTVHVWAYPHSGAPAVFLGVAAYGGQRPDVGSAFGDARFTPSGYGLTASGLGPGTYTLAVFPYSTVSGAFAAAGTIVITVW